MIRYWTIVAICLILIGGCTPRVVSFMRAANELVDSKNIKKCAYYEIRGGSYGEVRAYKSRGDVDLKACMDSLR